MSEYSIAIAGQLLALLITLGVFGMVIYLRKYKNLERMAMIEKGLSPDLFKSEHGAPSTLRWALLLIGVGIGFLMGYMLDRVFDMEEVGYFSMLFIFGGAGLGMAYKMEEARRK